MTINIEKKHLLIGVVALGIVLLGMLGLGAAKNATYMKRAKNCQKDIHFLYYASSLLSSELHDVWSEYIREDREYVDRNTGKFYNNSWSAPSGADMHYCSSFSVAISEKSDYYESKGVNNYIDSLYTSVKGLMTKMTPAPKKYSEIHANINALFHTAEAMYNCAVSPEGSLVSYTSELNTLSSDYKKQSSQVDIEIGELDEKELREKEYEVLMLFLK